MSDAGHKDDIIYDAHFFIIIINDTKHTFTPEEH